MILPYLPSVVSALNPDNSVSVERILKNAYNMILNMPVSEDDGKEDIVAIVLDDLEYLISKINRS